MPEYKRPKRFRFAHFKIENYSPSQRDAFFRFINSDLGSFRYVQADVIAGRRNVTPPEPRCLHLFMIHGKNALSEQTWKTMIPKEILVKNWTFEPVDTRVRSLMEQIRNSPYNAYKKVIGTPPHQGVSHTMYNLRKQAEELGIDHTDKRNLESLEETLDLYQRRMQHARKTLEEEDKKASSAAQTGDTIGRYTTHHASTPDAYPRGPDRSDYLSSVLHRSIHQS